MSIDLFNILFHILNLIVLVIIMRLLLYKPVKKFMANRAQEQQKAFDDLEARKSQLEQEAETLNQEKVRLEGDIEEERAKQSAFLMEQRDKMIAEAEEKSRQLILVAREQIEKERVQNQKNVEKEAVTLAVDIVGKLVSEKLPHSDHVQLIESYMNEVQPNE